MHMKVAALALAVGLAVGTAAVAEDAAAVTATAAKKADYMAFAGGSQGGTIDRVVAGPNDSVASVAVIYDDRIIQIPGSTVSAVSERKLQTSLTAKEVRKLP